MGARVSLAPTRRGWGVLLLAGLLASLWFVIRMHDLWYLVALLAALLVIELLGALASPLFVRYSATLYVSSAAPEVGEMVSLAAAIRRRPSARLPVAVQWQVGQQRLVRCEETGPGAPSVSVVRWRARHRGWVRFGIREIVAVSPLGLVRMRRHLRTFADLLVYPRQIPALLDMLEGDAGGRIGGGATQSRSRTAPAGLPSGAVREYRTGDALRQVHWKQSARQGALLVNVVDGEEVRALALRLDTDPSNYASTEDFERAVSAAATIGAFWIRGGHALRLYLGGAGGRDVAEEEVLLRELAVASLESTSEGPEDGGHGRAPISVFVTGTLPDGHSALLTPHAEGMVVVVRDAPALTIPPSWELVVVPDA